MDGVTDTDSGGEIPSVGIALIDEEHRHFVSLLDRFNEKRLPPGACVGDMLAEVLVYTETHFTNEEIVMRDAGYPLYHLHKEQHDLAEAEMHRLTADGVSEEEIRTVLGRFIRNWFLLHIQSADMKLADWMRENGTEYRPQGSAFVASPCAPSRVNGVA